MLGGRRCVGWKKVCWVEEDVLDGKRCVRRKKVC